MDDATPQTEFLCGGKDYGTDLVALTVVHELGRIPYLKAVLAAPADSGSFKPGCEVEARAGYDGKTRPVFKGVLVAAGFSMVADKRLITLEARDKVHDLALGLRTALFLGKTDGEICAAIASGRGVGAAMPTTSPAHAQVQQFQTTDWDFVLSRLWASGLVADVRDGIFGAVPVDKLGSGKPKKIDVNKDPVLELDVTTDGRAWFDGVSFRAWDEAGQKEIRHKAHDVKPKLTGSFKGSGKNRQDALIPYAVEKDALAEASAALLWRLRQGAVRGRVRLSGLYEASPGDGLEIGGCGEMVDGKTVVWATRLEIAAGTCTVDLQFGWDFLDSLRSRHAVEGLAHPLAGGSPVAPGLYPAKVMNLSGDPDKGERIKVHIPLLHDEGKGVWARAAAVYAGSGHAVVFRPEKDDEVLVGFLGADPAFPVILGALPSKAASAPDSLAAKDEKNTHKGWVTKSGLTLLMDEEAKSVTVTTPAGQTLRLDDKDGAVTLKDKNGNSLTMNSGGITLKSGKDITLDADGNVTVKATRNFKAQGLACEVQGQQSVKVSGQATGELSSSGMLTVKGGLVKIN